MFSFLYIIITQNTNQNAIAHIILSPYQEVSNNDKLTYNVLIDENIFTLEKKINKLFTQHYTSGFALVMCV